MKHGQVIKLHHDVKVAPHGGAWIETSRSSCVCRRPKVAPHGGAWIETVLEGGAFAPSLVAPHGGAWIETPNIITFKIQSSWVAPHGGAWIETAKLRICQSSYSSHPTGVRGLKQ